MNAKKAKALRRLVYGDTSHLERTYHVGHEPQLTTILEIHDDKFVIKKNPTCLCSGLREVYQSFKKKGKQKGWY